MTSVFRVFKIPKKRGTQTIYQECSRKAPISWKIKIMKPIKERIRRLDQLGGFFVTTFTFLYVQLQELLLITLWYIETTLDSQVMN